MTVAPFVHDFYTKIHQLLGGLNHDQLTFRRTDRDFRFTDVPGDIVRQVLI